ncbi:MAG: radical SAM protein, partial [Planctomycetota bacterium]|nr:radical SAM protein [Planctomycetota bacterium]
MRYEEPVYRPPSEAESLLIQATIGCPHNRCTFCGMYKGKRFRVRRVSEILEDICQAKAFYGDSVRSIFFPDGNTIAMKTEQLCEVLRFCRERFENLSRMTVYGSAKFVVRKSLEELRQLKAAGLSRIHSGIESGDSLTLERIRKGATPEDIIESGRKVKEAGIEISEYLMIGIAGVERSEVHSKASAEVINAIEPDFVRIRTYVPVPNTPLWRAYKSGEFKLLTPHQALEEMKNLIQNINCRTVFLTDHISN